MKSLKQKIGDAGVTKKQVAKMVGTNAATLSRVISGKQDYVSKELTDKINWYLDNLNTNDKNIFKNMSNKLDITK